MVHVLVSPQWHRPQSTKTPPISKRPFTIIQVPVIPRNTIILIFLEDICFELLVQEKTSEDRCEEDVSVQWTGPFVAIATIHIPKQQFSSFEQKQYCEQLSFTPWHGIQSHMPLGKINNQR
jgi:hypothetical protein